MKSNESNCAGNYCLFTYHNNATQIHDPVPLLPGHSLQNPIIFSVSVDVSSEGYFVIPCAIKSKNSCTIYLVNQDGVYNNSIKHTIKVSGDNDVYHKFEKHNEVVIITVTDKRKKESYQFFQIDKSLILQENPGYILKPRNLVLTVYKTKRGNLIWIRSPTSGGKFESFNIKVTTPDGRVEETLRYNDAKVKLHLERNPRFSIHEIDDKFCFEIYYPEAKSRDTFNPTWGVNCFNRKNCWEF